jgi:hypothetical protein
MAVVTEAWKNLAFDKDPLERSQRGEKRHRVVRSFGFGPVMAALDLELDDRPGADAE